MKRCGMPIAMMLSLYGTIFSQVVGRPESPTWLYLAPVAILFASIILWWSDGWGYGFIPIALLLAGSLIFGFGSGWQETVFHYTTAMELAIVILVVYLMLWVILQLDTEIRARQRESE